MKLINTRVTIFLILSIMCLIGSAFIGYAIPIYTNKIFESVGGEEFSGPLIFLAIFFLCELIARFTYQLIMTFCVRDLLLNMRVKLYNNWIKTPTSEYKKKYPLGEVLSRIMSDTGAIKELINSGGLMIIFDGFFIIASLVSFIKINISLGLFLALSEAVIIIILFLISRYLSKVFLKTRRISGELSQTMSDLIGGIRQLYFHPHGNYLQKRANVAFDKFLNVQLKANIYDASYYSVVESLFPILILLTAFALPFTEMKQAAVIGTLIDLIQRSISPIKEVASKMATIQQAKTGFIRIFEFLGYMNPSDKLLPAEEKYFFDKFIIDIPYFSYGKDNFSLKNIHLKINKGELLGVTGPSGGGKSTLAKIITCGLLCPQANLSLVGKNKTLSYPKNNLYKSSVALINQSPHLFTEDLYFNMTLGLYSRKKFDDFFQEIRKELAYLRDWNIGPSTKIYPDKLSFGQKQLLCGVRACFFNRDVVVFDEISSSLDSKLEFDLRKIILKIQKSAFTIMIAHRIETILKAKKIIFIKQGEISAQGDHLFLLKNCSEYKSFIDAIS